MQNILPLNMNFNFAKTRRVVHLAVVLMLFSASLLAMTVPASATDTPTTLIVFTDKKVYVDWIFNQKHNSAPPPNEYGGSLSGDLAFYIYAIVLDEDGNIMTGRAGNLSGSINTTRLDHWDKSDTTVHHAELPSTLFNDASLTFYDDGATVPGDVAGDGIYVALSNPTDPTFSALDPYAEDHLHLNITVTDSTVGTEYTHALVSGVRCKDGTQSHSTHATGGTVADNCAACHPGYEHFYENISGTIPNSNLDVHFGRMNPPNVIMDGKGFGDWIWNSSSTAIGTATDVEWGSRIPGSRYCAACHITPDNSDVYDLGIGRTDLTNVPSCSQGVKTGLYENSDTTVTCHVTTKMMGSDIPQWSPASATTTGMQNYNIANAKSHNHTSNIASVPCALCHSTPHGTTMPNMTADITITGDINEQCYPCHSSEGPSSSPHGATTTNCAACHVDDSSKLDAHLVPVGKAGAPDCGRCHDTSASNPVNIDVDITNMSSGAHANLNSLATSSGGNASNEKCWACHGTLVGTWADESEQPADSHNSTYYNNPRTCPNCHENTDTNTNFSAPQLVEHKEGAPVVPTTGTQCSICHNNSLTTIGESDGFGISGGDAQNASVSHYLTNTTLMTAQNKSDDCIWCHITNTANASWSTPTYPDVTANYTHTAQNRDQNSDCYGCHGGLTAGVIFHDTGITAGVAPGPDCIACHDVDGIAGFDVDVTNMASGTHNNLNNLSTVSALSAENKRCWACHGILAGGDADESDQPTTGHPANYNSPRVCPECHENTNSGTNFSAPQVVEHTESAPTVPTASVQCSLCHNNSLTTITEIDGYGLSVGGNAQNATASHYSQDANDNLMTGSIHSDDCIWCHITNTANASWGTPFDPQNSSSYLHTADNVAQNDTCYGCHGGLSASVIFHDTGITAGSAGGQDCISCHEGTTGNKVNIVNMNQSNSIHSVVNSGGNATGSADNKMCYACHTNDTYISGGVVNDTGIPTDSHPTGYDTPKNCTLCHTNTNSGTNFSAPQVVEHISTGTDLKTRSYADLNDSCTACHIATEMLSSYTDTNGTDYSNVSHYGISRNNTALVTDNVVDCTYCHQNASTAFDFVDSNNYTLSNHSSNYPSTTPACTECHNSGRMHDAGLTTPTLNDTLCVGCHTTREKHATTVQCVSCHVDSTATRDKVHPVKYINAAAGFVTSNTTAVNCTNCHQQSVTGFSAAPMVPFPLNHSEDPLAGGKWDSYWDNTSQLSSCIYCHGDTKHNNDSLGRISSIASGDVVNGTINGSGNWCAGCHVQTDSDYNKMVANYTNVTVPPEITGNGTYGANSSNPAFFSHSGWSNYSDAYCLDCHGNYVTGSTMDEFMHDVSIGVGCSNCHYDYSFMSTRNPERYVNESMYAASVHAVLDCEDCHTKGHNNIGARKACEACHVVQADPLNDTNRHNITNDPLNNMVGDNSSVYITDCTVCHDSTIYNDSITNFNKDTTYDCDWCHTYPDKNNEYFY